MRELTGDTRIRVRRPRPEPRKRELTGDTRIRLSQIADLKDWALEMAQDEAAPEGAVHHWSDGDHVKKNGKWVPVQKKTQKQERPEERQLASRYNPSLDDSKFFAYIESLYGEKKCCPSIKSFIKKSKAQVYKKDDPILTSNGTNIEPEITNGLTKLKEVTGEQFDNVIILDTTKGMDGGIIGEVFDANPFRRTLLINKDSPYWTDEEFLKDFLEKTSTKIKEHVFFHEMGHKKFASLPHKWNNRIEEEAIASQLSSIATRSPDELQSELYAGKHLGIKVDPEVIELYERYGGNYESL